MRLRLQVLAELNQELEEQGQGGWGRKQASPWKSPVNTLGEREEIPLPHVQKGKLETKSTLLVGLAQE